MEVRSSNIKKNIRDTCDSILKNLESPPKKKPRINLPTDPNFKEPFEQISENPVSVNLYKVVSFSKEEIGDSLILNLTRVNDETNSEITCSLFDSWSNTNIEKNYLVHLLTDAENDGNYILNDSKGFLIVNPQHILSGTNILSALHCLKKAVLSWKFKENGSNSSYMVLGTLLHSLFQTAISTRCYSKTELNNLLIDLLKQKKIISQLYECDLDEEAVLKETVVYLSSIEKWLRDNVVNQSKNLVKNLNIGEIHDIEESIWSPKYGIRGNLDLTVRAEIKISAYKPLLSMTKKENLNQTQNHVIPIELKSGRTTFSVEHEGQVMLYSLLNYEKRKKSDFGLLLYLKDMSMKFIKVNQNSLRGLIQLRNDLVHYVSSNELPEFKNEDRICSKCSLLTVCSLLSEKKITANDSLIYSNSIKHLNETDKFFFFKWYKMLELEFGDYKQFDAGETLWWKSQNELESSGFAVFNLKFDPKSKACQTEKEGFNSYLFVKIDSEINRNLLIKENDMILLSSMTDNHIGIAQGFIKSINSEKTQFCLLLDKQLEKIKTDQLYRIDKINFRSAINLNYSNLSRLMNPNERSLELRSYVIDKKIPEFDKLLPKHHVLSNKTIFKTLNKSQQASIIKALMAHNYLLIKGYPGTGKTTTIAALIAILVNLGKKVLFTSFTNSAVDNLLLKIVHQYSIDFMRIGNYDRIHPEIKKFELNSLINDIKSISELDIFFKEKKLIATTCSSINNSIFNKLDFDYCIVDEASQVLFTTCLGPLFICKKFILVGDLEQLPPIIKNKDARLMGMNVSLFEWLDSNEGSVELVHQYRMNREIMNLANVITYNGKLECLSSSTANGFISICADFLSSIKLEKMRKIFTESIIFIDTSNIIRSIENVDPEDKNENRIVNKTESEIVDKLVNIYFKFGEISSADDVGIIAPYNNQVKEIQKRLSIHPKYKEIEVNTVDQFQGRDKKMIIMSFTNSIIKSEETKEFEILNDKRRLTVSITRAKQKLILIGSRECLSRYKSIDKLIEYLKSKNLITVPDNINEFYF